jgi:hypothetical protein
MMYLVYYAYAKTASHVSAATTVDDFDSILLDTAVYPHWETAFNYANRLRTAFVDYPA